MYDGSVFYWNGAVKVDTPPVDGAVGSSNGGVMSSNCMLLAAYKHVNEIWLQRGRAGVPWYANVTWCKCHVMLRSAISSSTSTSSSSSSSSPSSPSSTSSSSSS